MPFWSHFIPYAKSQKAENVMLRCRPSLQSHELGEAVTRNPVVIVQGATGCGDLAILDGWSQPESTMGWCDKGWTAHFCHSNLLSAGAMATHALTKRTSKEGKSMKKQQVWSCWPPLLHVRVRGPVRPGSPHLFNGKRLAVMPWNMAKGNCNEQHIMMLSEAQWVSCFLAHRWWSKDSKDVFGAHK